MSSEVEETLKRIQAHKGVTGVIILNVEGVPIKSTMDNTTTVQYASLITQLTDKARHTVRDIDPTNDLTFLRIRSKKHEIMVAPGTWNTRKLLKDYSLDIPTQEFQCYNLVILGLQETRETDKEYILIVVQHPGE